MIPGEPRKLSTVRAEARIGIEVGALHQRQRHSLFHRIDGDDAIGGFFALSGVVFADGDEAVARGIKVEVGKA